MKIYNKIFILLFILMFRLMYPQLFGGVIKPIAGWSIVSVASYNGISVVDKRGMGYNGHNIEPTSTIILNVNVVSNGPYNISYTHPSTGLVFSANGIFTTIGNQTITLSNNGAFIPWDINGDLIMNQITNSKNTFNILPRIDVLSIPANQTVINVVRSGTGRQWMDRNLGARKAATELYDILAYGNLYNWGRLSDGHELDVRSGPLANGAPLNGSTTILSTGDVPGHNKFIYDTVDDGNWFNWRITPNPNLWQGVSGINNPCPSGFRIPTHDELAVEWSQYSTMEQAAASPMKWAAAGIDINAVSHSTKNYMFVWNSSVATGTMDNPKYNYAPVDIAWRNGVLENLVNPIWNYNGDNKWWYWMMEADAGLPVRCIKN